jgi:hypothetical protein
MPLSPSSAAAQQTVPAAASRVLSRSQGSSQCTRRGVDAISPIPVVMHQIIQSFLPNQPNLLRQTVGLAMQESLSSP